MMKKLLKKEKLMKCGFRTFSHSKPDGKKKKERICFIWNQLETSLPSKGKAYGSGNVYSENHGYPEKIQAAF